MLTKMSKIQVIRSKIRWIENVEMYSFYHFIDSCWCCYFWRLHGVQPRPRVKPKHHNCLWRMYVNNYVTSVYQSVRLTEKFSGIFFTWTNFYFTSGCLCFFAVFSFHQNDFIRIPLVIFFLFYIHLCVC